MCPYPMSPINVEYMRDVRRGRDWSRFYKLAAFANRRWRDTQDLRRARQWLAIMETIERRRPM